MKKLKLEELGRVNVEEFKASEKAQVVVVLDNLRSMNNVGSAFRTSDALAIQKMILCGVTATPPHRDIQKTALGAQDSVEWEYAATTKEALLKLKSEGYKIVGVEQTDSSVMLPEFKPTSAEKIAFVFGNEVFGVSDEVLEDLDLCVEIPQFGTKHSFNVSVTIGIILWDYYSKTKF